MGAFADRDVRDRSSSISQRERLSQPPGLVRARRILMEDRNRRWCREGRSPPFDDRNIGA